MNLVVCKMFGSPVVKEKDKQVYLPTGKVSGLFYYILMKKVVSRDEAAGLFWPSSNDERAKISLRNALHKIRRAFDEDIILTPNKSILKINEDINFTIDILDFEKNPMENLDLYKGEFLKGFYIKDTAEFDNWLAEQRSYYEEIYISNLEKKITIDIENNKYENIEIYIRNLLSVDNFNERAYLLLMNYYIKIGRYDKVVNEYYNVQNILIEELGIEPGEDIEKVYKSAVLKIESRQDTVKEDVVFYDRNYEINLLRKNIDDFYNGLDLKSIVLRGETGVGKTMIKKQLLDENKDRFMIFETNCYNVEQEFSFSPWHKIIFRLNKEINDRNEEPPILWNDMLCKLFPDATHDNIKTSGLLENRENFNLDIIYNVIYSAIEQISKDKKIIIVMEDIQWADTLSIKLLINLALHLNNEVLFIITTTEEKNQKIDNLILSLKSVNKILVLDIKRFDRNITENIIRKAFKNKEITSDEIDEIYEKSNGNALFLKEYIELYKNGQKDLLTSDTINDLLKTKFSNINIHEIHVLERISLFYKEVKLEMLLKFGNINAYDLLTAINSLEKKGIVETREENSDSYIKFVHKIYRDYIYQNLNQISRKIMHLEVAKVLESELSYKNRDITQYLNIKNHYELANDKVNVIKYEVYILNYYLNYNHELFPNLDDFDVNNQMKIYMKNSKVLEKLENIEEEILKIKNYSVDSKNIDELNNIELMFLYCKGRYLIRGGNYSDGIKVINRVIKLSCELKDYKMMLAGYKQMVIYGIQINDTSIMIDNILPALKEAKKLGDNIEQGVLLRLYGLYYLMKSEPEHAEKLFINSIEMINSSALIKNNNSISVAADYNYIGEIRKSEMEFERAKELFKKSICLCKDLEAPCLSIFYINLAKTSFLTEDYKEMKEYLYKAKNISKEFDSYWEGPVIDSYFAMSMFIEGKYLETIEYLKSANKELNTINNPRDFGIIYFIETLIRIEIEKKENEKYKEVKNFLNEPSEYYFYQSLKYLDEYRDLAEITFLKKELTREIIMTN